MKQLLLTALMALLSLAAFQNGFAEANAAAPQSIYSENDTWSIVMEHDLLGINTGDPNDPVATISVVSTSGATVLTVDDCRQQFCTVDVSGLHPGEYTVYVTTASNFTFWAKITLC